MSSVAGPLHAAALVVLVAGIAKAARPTAAGAALRSLGLPGSRLAVRALAVVEVAIAVAVPVGAGGGRWAVAALAALHVAFAAVSAGLRARSATCGCFGEAAPVTGVHLAVNVIVAVVAGAAAAAGDIPSLGAMAGGTPGAGVPYVLLVVTLAVAEIACLTALADAQAAAAPFRRRAETAR